jgi:micrococcal nuclease
MVRAVSESLAFAGAAWLAAFLCSTQACDLPAAETATVASAIDGETPRLTDGRTVRLIGAKAPMPPLGWRGDDPWPLVEDAKQGLEALALGNRSTLASADEAAHGHLLAQVFVVAGGERVWLQHEMVARGLARVYSFADNRACTPAGRRERGEGETPRCLALPHPHLSIGRGQGGRGRRGPHPDLSQSRAGLAARFHHQRRAQGGGRLRRCGIDLKALAGKRLRVRGTLAWRNGPMIEASHPEQIELLPEGPPQGM